MKKIRQAAVMTLIVVFCFIFTVYPVSADDTCVFMTTADELILDPAPKEGAAEISGSDILSRAHTLSAPVVPAAKTISQDKVYMAFFRPDQGSFWEGNIAKYGISPDNRIVDANDDPATGPYGSIKKDAVPYWRTLDWSDVTKNNYIHHSNRNIYTYLNRLVRFEPTNAGLTAAILGNPTGNTSDIINYVRGADVLDEDGDGDVAENRSVITGDILHSEPSIFKYRYSDGTARTMVYFGANDGMLHAVLDETENSGISHSTTSYGTEVWAFIPPDQLPRLKEMMEGFDHQSYIDATPKIYFKDIDGDGVVDSGGKDRVILVCGERKGGTGYFALDVTDPSFPQYLWRINQHDDSGSGWAAPTTVISELGETWSEPQFGVVKTSDSDTIGTPVFFIGGGYSSNNSSGKAVIAVDVMTGAVVKKFTAGMNYSVPSTVAVIDENDNGFVDKVYVGDLGGQMWRFASFVAGGRSLVFPHCNENIDSWTGQVFFRTDNNNSRKFFYPPSVTLEKGYDMVFVGTGDRENACCNNRNNVCSFNGPDIITAVKDTHASLTIVVDTDLVDVTNPGVKPPNLSVDQGWFLRLVDSSGNAVGEKVLSEGTVFYNTFYVATFTPGLDSSVSGGIGKLYALSYLTGAATLDFDNDSKPERMSIVGESIPSKPVMLISKTCTSLLISVVDEKQGAVGPAVGAGAGIKILEPLLPPANFFYRYWKEIF